VLKIFIYGIICTFKNGLQKCTDWFSSQNEFHEPDWDQLLMAKWSNWRGNIIIPSILWDIVHESYCINYFHDTFMLIVCSFKASIPICNCVNKNFLKISPKVFHRMFLPTCGCANETGETYFLVLFIMSETFMCSVPYGTFWFIF